MTSGRYSNVAVLLMVMAFGSAKAPAQAASQKCGGTHRPGDHITCYVTFAGNTDFTDLQVTFYVADEDTPRPHGRYFNFTLSDTRKVGPRVYAVSGVVDNNVPGTYRLASVSARTTKDGQYYTNLKGAQIEIENDSGEPAPARDKQAEEAFQSQDLPHVVETPPPDPAIFPRIMEIKSGPSSAPPVVDVASWFARWLPRPNTCGGKHKHGETVICRVQFQGSPQFQTVGLSFRRIDTRTTLYQSQQCPGFSEATLKPFAPLAAGLYEVKGIIPNCRSGKYKIAGATAFAYSSGDTKNLYVRNYFNGTDFKSAIVLKVQDNISATFPALIRVGDSAN